MYTHIVHLYTSVVCCFIAFIKTSNTALMEETGIIKH